MIHPDRVPFKIMKLEKSIKFLEEVSDEECLILDDLFGNYDNPSKRATDIKKYKNEIAHLNRLSRINYN